MERAKVISVIYEVFDEMNEDRDAESLIPKSESTVLLGRDGSLDSVDVLHFISNLEDRLEDLLGDEIDLVDEASVALENSPYKSVSTMADFILKKVE